MKSEEHTLTLDELSDQVGQLLSRYALLGAQQDHRVSQVPDARTIRYYTTLGLLDRPRIDGRQAKYGRRHVLQVLAIKALQAINLPLSEVQTRLYGRSDQELEAILASLKEFWQKSQSTAKPELETIHSIQHSTSWREVIIEPGMKLMIQDGWSPQQDKSATLQKISAVLEALLGSKKQNGGESNDH